MNLALFDHNIGYQNILSDLRRGALSHAYMLISPDKEARQAIFKKVCLSYFCPSVCGKCGHCKKIMSDNHINITVLDGANKIKVAEIIELTEDTHILPVDGDRKFYFIDNAQLLDARVQNKLLKTYEEPPSFVTIFLGVANESGLLNTIKSRGKHIYIERLKNEAVLDQLIELGFDLDTSQEAVAYAMGNMEKALLFASDDGYKTAYEQTFNTLMTLKNSSQIIDHLYKDIFHKDNIRLTLDFMEIFLSDIIKIITNNNLERLTINRDYDLNKMSKDWSLAGVSMALNAINNARERLNYNVSAVSVAEKVMFDILEARYKWQQ